MRLWAIVAGVAAVVWHVLTTRDTERASGGEAKPLDRDAFLRMQFAEASNTYRTQFTVYCQIAAALVAANVAVLGAAFTTGRVSLLILAALFPLMLFYLRRRTYALMKPILFHAVYLESVYGLHERGLATDFLRAMTSRHHADEVVTALKIEDPDLQYERLVAIDPPLVDTQEIWIAIPLIAFVEASLPFIAFFGFGWNLM